MYSDAIRTTASSELYYTVQDCCPLALSGSVACLRVFMCYVCQVYNQFQLFPFLFFYSMIENVLVLNDFNANRPILHGSHFEHMGLEISLRTLS